MEMGIGEIRRQYKYAKDRKKCISILADLNCCSTGRILEIVHTQSECQKEQSQPAQWLPTSEQKALIDRLDELDALIKSLENEYRRTVAELIKIAGK